MIFMFLINQFVAVTVANAWLFRVDEGGTVFVRAILLISWAH